MGKKKQKKLPEQNLWLIDDMALDQLKELYTSDYQRTMDIENDGTTDGGGGIGGDQPIINVHGPLLPRSDLMTQFFGLTTYQDIDAQLSHWEAELPEGSTLYLDVDSGGGSGSLLFPLAERINNSSLNTVAYVSGRAASAAYVLAASCDEIHVDETSEVGGLGVRTGYLMDEDKPKNMIISSNSPSKDATQEEAQANADQLEDIMYKRLHEWRGHDGDYEIEKTASAFGNGKMLFGSDAKEKGMADEVLTASPYNLNNDGGTMPYSEKQLQEKLEEQKSLLEADFEKKLKTATDTSKSLAEAIHSRYEKILSTEAGQANPVKALRFAKDDRFSLEEAEEFLKDLAPAKEESKEPEGDPLKEAIDASGGTAELSTLLDEEGKLPAKKTAQPKEENNLLGVAQYGSRMQDTYKLAIGEYKGGVQEYTKRWADVPEAAEGE